VQTFPAGAPHTALVWGLAIALVVAILALVGFRRLAVTRIGRLALLVAAVLLPLAASFGGVNAGVVESSRTRFCLKCHEMQPLGRSLFVDHHPSKLEAPLAAVHFQNRYVDRDTACYSCHADYALFGDVKAKLNGLHHVQVHYLGKVPARFELYQPYPNRNCLHCHEDARPFVDAAPHKPILAALESGQTSCLSCHRVAHDLERAETGPFWQGATQ
jgi:cytochrome c-type protein NapC